MSGCEPHNHRSGWRRRKRDRPGEILVAALDVISRRGYERTRMSDIADRADITKGTIYLYFNSKAELFHRCRILHDERDTHATRSGTLPAPGMIEGMDMREMSVELEYHPLS